MSSSSLCLALLPISTFGVNAEDAKAYLRAHHVVSLIHIFVHLSFNDHSVTQTGCHSSPADLYAYQRKIEFSHESVIPKENTIVNDIQL